MDITRCRHPVDNKQMFLIRDADSGMPIVTEDHSLMVGGKKRKPEELSDDFNLDSVVEYPTRGKKGVFHRGIGKGSSITEIDVSELYCDSKRNHDRVVTEDEVIFQFKYKNTNKKKGWKKGEVWKFKQDLN